ncbi:MarR family transcriptional regulator, partial [Bacillus cereus]|uniref:MarR family transcriptional regulator n=1 Tax=Bacillus cereus TaxID=1396 RepID=UPI000C0380D3
MKNVKDILIQARENAVENGCSDVATYISDSQQITRNKFLSITERGVLQSMFHWFHSDLQKSIGRYKLASELYLSVRTITTVVQKLESMGFIEVKRRKNKL